MTTPYERIEAAIRYIQAHAEESPDLDRIAEQVHVSPFHFQRLFTEWAGVSLKQFLQYIRASYAKQLLASRGTLFDVSEKMGLSSSSRLHDLFIRLEAMTPAQYRAGGAGLSIVYEEVDTRFGKALLASSSVGICHLAFIQPGEDAFATLQRKFPQAQLQAGSTPIHQSALRWLQGESTKLDSIKLHVRGTDFQLKVWEALLKIPMGQLTTYGRLAEQIDSPNASRAVGSAIGDNPIAFLIPCHRVIRSSGIIGEYRWGSIRKSLLLGWEAAQVNR
jgi:AraC family transcriptional regulator of adaptative response/methylated-DNA-[protein]-cysteine methyltransferase